MEAKGSFHSVAERGEGEVKRFRDVTVLRSIHVKQLEIFGPQSYAKLVQVHEIHLRVFHI